jgi:hypothetical protein
MKKIILIIVVIIVLAGLGVGGYFLWTNVLAKPIVWDGTYKETGTLNCQGNFPNLTTVPIDSTTTVKDNQIVEEKEGKSFPIDKNGRATEEMQFTENGLTTTVTAHYQFVKEGDTYKFTATGSATLSATQDNKTYSSTCSGTTNGVKQ